MLTFHLQQADAEGGGSHTTFAMPQARVLPGIEAFDACRWKEVEWPLSTCPVWAAGRQVTLTFPAGLHQSVPQLLHNKVKAVSRWPGTDPGAHRYSSSSPISKPVRPWRMVCGNDGGSPHGLSEEKQQQSESVNLPCQPNRTRIHNGNASLRPSIRDICGVS